MLGIQIETHIRDTGETSGKPLFTNVTNQPSDPATGTNQTTHATRVGPTNESAAGSDTATSGLNGLVKCVLQKLTADLGLAANAAAGLVLTTATVVALAKRVLVRGFVSCSQGKPACMRINGNYSTTSALNIYPWVVMLSYAVPSGKVLEPLGIAGYSSTSGYFYKTAIKRRIKVGSFNFGTNVYTQLNTAPTGCVYTQLYFLSGAVTGVTQSGANNSCTVDITYTNQDGGNSTAVGRSVATTGTLSERSSISINASDTTLTAVTACANNTHAGTLSGSADLYADYVMLQVAHNQALAQTYAYASDPNALRAVFGEEVTLEILAASTTLHSRACFFNYRLLDATAL